MYRWNMDRKYVRRRMVAAIAVAMVFVQVAMWVMLKSITVTYDVVAMVPQPLMAALVTAVIFTIPFAWVVKKAESVK